jgi:hypothetical protein
MGLYTWAEARLTFGPRGLARQKLVELTEEPRNGLKNMYFLHAGSHGLDDEST